MFYAILSGDQLSVTGIDLDLKYTCKHRYAEFHRCSHQTIKYTARPCENGLIENRTTSKHEKSRENIALDGVIMTKNIAVTCLSSIANIKLSTVAELSYRV